MEEVLADLAALYDEYRMGVYTLEEYEEEYEKIFDNAVKEVIK